LSPELLAEAHDALNAADVVLGPALDGGYYLIGLRADEPRLFQNIAWGTDAVRAQTRDAARRLNLTVRELRPLSDIDEPEDLVVWRRVVGRLPGESAVNRPGIVSVIIPTLNESSRIAEAVRPLVAAPDVEVIVADGGSTDGTADVAQASGARVVVTRRGRGRQMNAGAAVATGERLLFLHADTRLPDGFTKDVGRILNDGACAGAFRLRIDGGHRGLRVVEWGANVRSSWLQLPYGDQGLFLPAELFYRLGGYQELPLMEDFEFCRRLKRHGRIGLADAAVSTSARRWEQLGVVRTTLVNQLCVAGYLLGISPERLARWYSRCWRVPTTNCPGRFDRPGQ
jgi:rSAM/selenodomain-associated transferase 2